MKSQIPNSESGSGESFTSQLQQVLMFLVRVTAWLILKSRMYQKLAWNQTVNPFDFPIAQSEQKAIPSEDEWGLFVLG